MVAWIVGPSQLAKQQNYDRSFGRPGENRINKISKGLQNSGFKDESSDLLLCDRHCSHIF
jgi:hypothetical protein